MMRQRIGFRIKRELIGCEELLEGFRQTIAGPIHHHFIAHDSFLVEGDESSRRGGTLAKLIVVGGVNFVRTLLGGQIIRRSYSRGLREKVLHGKDLFHKGLLVLARWIWLADTFVHRLRGADSRRNSASGSSSNVIGGIRRRTPSLDVISRREILQAVVEEAQQGAGWQDSTLFGGVLTTHQGKGGWIITVSLGQKIDLDSYLRGRE